MFIRFSIQSRSFHLKEYNFLRNTNCKRLHKFALFVIVKIFVMCVIWQLWVEFHVVHDVRAINLCKLYSSSSFWTLFLSPFAFAIFKSYQPNNADAASAKVLDMQRYARFIIISRRKCSSSGDSWNPAGYIMSRMVISWKWRFININLFDIEDEDDFANEKYYFRTELMCSDIVKSEDIFKRELGPMCHCSAERQSQQRWYDGNAIFLCVLVSLVE